MTKYEKLYEIGEEHLMSLFQLESPRSIIGLSHSVEFNDNDSCTHIDGIVQFFLADGKYTLFVTVNKLKNTFDIFYSDITTDFESNEFSFRNIPYKLSEEWHFQLSTVKHMPFTYKFFLTLYEYVDRLEELNSNSCNLKVLREIYNIPEPEYR